MPSKLSATLSTAVTLLFLVGGLAWVFFFFSSGDAWIRGWVGRYFGVTIELGARAHWRVRERGTGTWLIELLQLFELLFALIVWGLWMAIAIVLSQVWPGR